MIYPGKVKREAVPLPPSRQQGVEEVQLYSLTSALDGVSGRRHVQTTLYSQGKDAQYPLGLTAGLDTEARGKILCLCQGSNPGCPVCS
jgi:hypothetical protein